VFQNGKGAHGGARKAFRPYFGVTEGYRSDGIEPALLNIIAGILGCIEYDICGYHVLQYQPNAPDI
jgi:hypothetical protein